MMLTMAMVMAAAVSGAEPAMISAYSGLCTNPGDSQPQILARADREGWRRDGAGTPADFDATADRFKVVGDTVLKLVTSRREVADETIESCGISVLAPQPALWGDVAEMLGFAPAFEMSGSATFYALREDGAWRNGSGLSKADFAAAKAAGRFYSVMAVSSDSNASLFSLRIRPRSPAR